MSVCLTWLSTALGLSAKSVEAASNLPMPLILLPFFGSGFVPTESMPTVVRWFAEYQPFTPMIETLRGLLLGTEIGWSGPTAIGWCVALSILGCWWALRLYDRGPLTRRRAATGSSGRRSPAPVPGGASPPPRPPRRGARRESVGATARRSPARPRVARSRRSRRR